ASRSRPITAPREAGAATHVSGRRLLLSPDWEERLRGVERGSRPGSESILILPRQKAVYLGTLTPVEDRAGAEGMLDLSRQRPISYAGFDCEYRYSRPGVFLKRVGGREHLWYDPTSIVPLLMAVALAEVRGDGEADLYRFVIDLRKPGVLG